MEDGRIIFLKDYRTNKLIGELWEYPDSYEYCLIPNYEDKFLELRMEAIQMDGCFANLVKNGDHYVLISILFSKEWEVGEITEWLENYQMSLFKPGTMPIEIPNVHSIVESKKFFGHPIVLSERGSGTIQIDPNELDELTEEYKRFNKITNTGLAQPVELAEEYLDKDDCLDRKYPGVVGETKEPDFLGLMKNVQYSDAMRGLFVECANCHFKGVTVHFRTFEIEEPHCTHCGKKVDASQCKWVNGPFLK